MSNIVLDQKQIAAILPHEYPFIMIDRVIEFEKNKSLVAIKNISGNEWVFASQCYKTDIFPETLLIEAASQAALVLYQLSKKKDNFIRNFVLGEIKSDFFKVVRIYQQLKIIVFASKMLEKFGYMDIELLFIQETVGKIRIKYSVIS